MFVLYMIAALFIFLGWGIDKKGWHGLISGYNTMTPAQQAEVDITSLAKAIAKMMYVTAVLLVLLAIGIQFELALLMWIALVLIIITPIKILLETRKYYGKGKTPMRVGVSPKNKKVSIAITAVSFIGAAVIVYFAMQPTSYTVTDEQFTVKGMYGDAIPWEEMEQLQLKNELPSIAARTNGSAVGSKLKGNFKFDNGERALLFVDKSVAAFIVFEWKGQVYYVNESSVEETEALYKEMETAYQTQ